MFCREIVIKGSLYADEITITTFQPEMLFWKINYFCYCSLFYTSTFCLITTNSNDKNNIKMWKRKKNRNRSWALKQEKTHIILILK